MTPRRSLLIAVVAVLPLVCARVIDGAGQFPRGLLAGATPTVGQNRSCTIETRPISFGTYNTLLDTDLDAIGQIIYTCENGNLAGKKPAQKGIRIEMAQGSSNSFAPRHMYGLSFEDLEYNIYLDATRRQVWGTGEGPTQVYIDEHPPNQTPVIVTAFGRIFGRQDVPAGSYTDNVPVRILF
jgi:spore coat protein U-like protein